VAFYRRGPLHDQLRTAGVAIHYIEKRGRWDIFGAAWSLIAILRQLQGDVIQSYLTPPNVAIALLRPLLPKHSLVWGIRASNMDNSRYDWLRSISVKVERYLSRVPDLVIANARAGLKFCEDTGFRFRRSEVIPNGIDLEAIERSYIGRVAARSAIGIPAEKLVVGLVARLDHMKDHKTFLLAAAEISLRIDDIHFVCVGSGPEALQAELREFAQGLGLEKKVTWLGHRSDVASLLNAFDIATLSSSFGEGFPNALGEAMGAGLPVVSTNVGDALFVVGGEKFIVPPENPRALAAGWQTLFDMGDAKRREVGDSNRERIRSHFSVDAMVRSTESAYLSILGNAKNVA